MNLDMIMNTGFNHRTRVTFQLEAPPNTPEKKSGHPPNAESTPYIQKTTMSQVSSKAKHYAELLKDLSGSNFEELASVLLQHLGSRGRTARRKKKRPTIGRKRKSYELSDSESETSYSASFSSGQDSSYYDTSESEEKSPQHRYTKGKSYPAQTKLAPLPGQADFQPLGPCI